MTIGHYSTYIIRRRYDDMETYRHWHPESEPYAPAEVLLQYLRLGWSLDAHAAVKTFYYAGYRRSDVYYFTLERGDKQVEMPVLANPAVFRVVDTYKVSLSRVNVQRGPIVERSLATV